MSVSPTISRCSSINEIGISAWWTAETAGWHGRALGGDDRIGLSLALVHSEVSEALEAYRLYGTVDRIRARDGKPEGWGSELADIIIRVAELAHITECDLSGAIVEKMAYNKTRSDVPNGTDTRKKF